MNKREAAAQDIQARRLARLMGWPYSKALGEVRKAARHYHELYVKHGGDQEAITREIAAEHGRTYEQWMALENDPDAMQRGGAQYQTLIAEIADRTQRSPRDIVRRLE